MKPAAFDYVRAASLQDAVEVISADEDAKLMAGGQSLVPLLNMRLVRPTVVVDLGRLDELVGISHTGGTLRIGAMTRQRDAELSADVAAACPLLVEALHLVAHPQIRNRGTIGGSLAHADPAAELPAATLVHDATMHVLGPGGRRTIAADDFFVSYLTTALEVGEVLTAVELPVPAASAGWACQEVTLRPGDFPLCGAVALVELDAGGTLADVRVALFAVADRPMRMRAAEQLLLGSVPEPELLASAAEAAADELTPTADVHASAEYRRRLVQVVMRRALAQAIERGRTRGER